MLNPQNYKLVAVLLILCLTACTTFRPARLNVRSADQVPIEKCAKDDTHYRMTLQDGRQIEVKGWALRCKEEGFTVQETSSYTHYSPGEITLVEEEKTAMGRTLLVIIGGGLALLGVIFIGAFATTDWNT